MWRTCSLAFLLLAGCGNESGQRQALDASWNEASQDAEIESLKSQIADLQKQDDFEDNEMGALAQGADSLQKQVNANAKTANENQKINDARWQAIRQRLGI